MTTSNRYSGFPAAVLAALLCAAAGAQEQGPEDEERDWKTSIAIGFNLTSGNSETTLGNASATLERQTEPHLVRIVVEGAYGESEVESTEGATVDETTAQNAKLSANYKRSLNGAFLYADATALHDDIAEIDYRFTPGLGAGYFLVKTTAVRLSAEAGAGYLWEDVKDIEDNYATFRAAQRLDWQISQTAKLWQTVEYLPRADDFKDYLLNAEIGVEAAMTTAVNLRVVIQDRYDNTPAAGKEENDIAVISALSMSL